MKHFCFFFRMISKSFEVDTVMDIFYKYKRVMFLLVTLMCRAWINECESREWRREKSRGIFQSIVNHAILLWERNIFFYIYIIICVNRVYLYREVCFFFSTKSISAYDLPFISAILCQSWSRKKFQSMFVYIIIIIVFLLFVTFFEN